MGRTSFLWLEITGKCQLECVQCYASSSPSGTHGSMSRADWLRVLDDAGKLGVEMVQFIGGEPTLHPDLADLVDHALGGGLEVEVFSNLVHVRIGCGRCSPGRGCRWRRRITPTTLINTRP